MATTPATRTAVLVGTPVDDVTMDEAVDRIAAMVEVGRATGRVHQVATVNTDFLVNARADRELLAIMQATDLSIPDGMGALWGGRAIGVGLRERTTGADLLPALAERAASSAWRICLFGAAPGVAERAAASLTERCPGAVVVGLPAPMIGADGSMDPTELEAIRATRADIVGVALGNPKQERWIARHGQALGVPVLIGIGGTLDFLTATTKRAPHWMQRAGLEWIYRALSDPRRLARRYAKDAVVYGPALAAQVRAGRRRSAAVVPFVDLDAPAGGGAGHGADGDGDGVQGPMVRLMGPLPLTMLDGPGIGPDHTGRTITVDVSALERLDNITVAAIVGLGRRAAAVGAAVTVHGLRPSARADAERLGVAELLGGRPV
jgi:N-acetylglucosaminyldiphosphoundecaprenol N-acetyl-beta-D-mannosaminyltransferase